MSVQEILEANRDLVSRTLIADGVPESQLEAALESVFEASRSTEEDPILDLLGEDGVAEIVTLNVGLAERGMTLEERAEVVEERIADVIGMKLSEHAEELEEIMANGGLHAELPRRSVAPPVLAPRPATAQQPRVAPNPAPALAAAEPEAFELQRLEVLQAAGLISPETVSFLCPFLTVTVEKKYASIRTGCATGHNGKKLPWKRKRRRLCVVATTAGAHVTAKLLWWTIFSRSAITTLVVGAHFRGLVPVIPNGAEPLTVGARRGNRVISKSRNAAVVAKACVFVDGNPNLRAVQWFGYSRDAESGINLHVSGGV